MIFNLQKIFLLFLLLSFLVLMHAKILTGIGSFLVFQNIPQKADAAVVLKSGVDVYPRLLEAADLYKKTKVAKVVINGNRKTDVLRKLENSGFVSPCSWHANYISILSYRGVPKDHIVAISAEDAYDTISEADIVGSTLINNGMTSIIITTSKFHSRRAYHIWKNMYEEKLQIYIASAANDSFDPGSWWKNGRQIRWVLSEYGAWLYYYWVKIYEWGQLLLDIIPFSA
jgi:uncharacterized SAM-binding protein YcdF (DUF218 family)